MTLVRIFVILSFILVGFVKIERCVGNKIPKTEETVEYSLEIKNESISTSYTQTDIFQDFLPSKAEITNNDPVEECGKEFPKRNFCKYCKIHFRFQTIYIKHFQEMHPDEKPYRCDYCHLPFISKHNSIKHMLRHHPDKVNFVPQRKQQKMTCQLCDTEHKGTFALEQHSLKFHEGVKTYKCPECEAKYYRIFEVNRHRLTKHHYQHEYHPFLCKLCKNFFTSSDVLEGHKTECLERQKMKNRPGNIEIDITELEKLNQRVTCNKCGLKSSSMKQLQEHMRLYHLEVKGIYSCKRCEKSFVRNETLVKHVDKYHPDFIGTELERKYQKLATYTCYICRKTLSGVEKYATHFKSFHPGEKAFRCAICGSGFACKSALKQHLKRMHGSEILCCQYCTKCFSLKSDLTIHEKSCGKKGANDGKKVFFCDICMKWSKGSLTWHKFRHDEFDYCKYCDRRFRREKNPQALLQHVAKRHPNPLNVDESALLVAASIMHREQEVKKKGTGLIIANK